MSNSQPVDVASVVASRDRLYDALDVLATAIEDHADVEVIGPKTAHARAVAGLREDVGRLGTKFAEDRLLRLGVVGQVKAGKSSLLNLLLFGGKEVLPQAATPMTASLTHITKSDRDEIEVSYYTKKDWAEIEEHTKEYKQMRKTDEDRTAQVPAFAQASHELMKTVAAHGIPVSQYLDTTAVETAPVSAMNDKLTSLVGADGKFAPLVKSVSIRCAQGIPDLDIVDTPGINDPISSRSRRAEKMLVDCDAVLLLSSAIRFMDDVDVKFFERKLPEEGIGNRLIIGSKFDLALIGEAHKFQGRLQRARDDTKRSLVSHARKAIQRLTEDVLESTADAQVVFTSATCSKLAAAPYDQWEHQEESVFDRLRRAYPDWLDAADESAGTITETTKETLKVLGNQQQLEDHLDELRCNKEQHIFASNQQTVEAKRVAARMEVDELLKSLHTYREKIISVKSKQVDEQMKKLVRLEHQLTKMIGDEWLSCVDREMKPLTTFRNELRAEAKEAKQKIGEKIEDASYVRTRIKEKKKKGFWNAIGRGLGLNRSDRVQEEELKLGAVEGLIDEVIAYINNKLDNLRVQMFNADFVRKSHETLGSIVDKELGNKAAEAYELEMPRALRDTIATVAANARDKLKRGGNFQPMELSSTEVDEGRRQATNAIGFIETQANRWADQVYNEWSQIAKHAECELVPQVVTGLRESQEQLKRDIEDRACKIDRIDSALQSIVHCQAALSGQS